MTRFSFQSFGDWRTLSEASPTAGLTDEGYTGHTHNNLGGGANDLGLVYMNARYYVPNTNRMVSPDTIVPDPTNPQSLNRYTYSLNNPIKYKDPDGHRVVEEDDGANYECHTTSACKTARDGGVPDYNPCKLDGICVYPKHHPKAGYQIPESEPVGVGASATVAVYTPKVQVKAAVGIEWIYDSRVGELTPFLVFSGSVSVGIDGNYPKKPRLFASTVNGYVVETHNVDDVPEDYSGWFQNETFTGALGHGMTVGEGVSLIDVDESVHERTNAYSNIVGYAGGYAATWDVGRSYYVPLNTCGLNGCRYNGTIGHLLNLATDFVDRVAP